jgi:hypothetical protein
MRPNVALGASNAPNATLGRMTPRHSNLKNRRRP